MGPNGPTLCEQSGGGVVNIQTNTHIWATSPFVWQEICGKFGIIHPSPNYDAKQKETIRQKSQFLSSHPYSFRFHTVPILNYHHITQKHIHTTAQSFCPQIRSVWPPLLFAVITQKPVACWIHVFNFFIFNYIVLEEFFETIKKERLKSNHIPTKLCGHTKQISCQIYTLFN